MPDQAEAFPNDCGFQCFARLLSYVGANQLGPIMSHDAAASWRFLYWQHVALADDNAPHTCVSLGGAQGELHVAIAAILREHGVPSEKVNQRAQDVVQSLGKEQLIKIIHDSRPWQALKQAANKCSPPMKLVQPDELAAVIKSRTGQRKSFGSNQNKAKDNLSASIQLHPNDFRVPAGVFCFDGGEHAAQVDIHQLNQGGKGLVVCNELEAEPFLQAGLGRFEGVAFIIINPSQQCIDKHGKPDRLPVQSITTGEPMLISAIVVTGGKRRIRRNIPSTIQRVEEVPVITIKVLMYKDQLSVQWNEFIQGPIRTFFQLVPWMGTCRKSNCSCPAWHKDGEDGKAQTEPVLDLWNKTFMSQHFKPMKSQDAELYAFAARIREDIWMRLSQISGQQGIYFEPRSPDGRTQHEQYFTVWLRQNDHSSAVAACAGSPQPAFLIRAAKRYGLKVQLQHAEEVHKHFHDDAPFIGAGASTVYQLGPLPWGATKKSLQTLFNSWGWKAVPLQCGGRSACQKGLMWLARAASPPEASAITMEHGDVIIVQQQAQHAQPVSLPRIEASQHTKRAMQQPTADFDPWADSAKRLPMRPVEPTSAQISPQQLLQIEQQVVAKLQREQEDVEMIPVLEPRVKSLEDRLNAIETTQQQQLVKTDQLQAQVERQAQVFNNHLDVRLAEQMDKLEALLTKRARNE